MKPVEIPPNGAKEKRQFAIKLATVVAGVAVMILPWKVAEILVLFYLYGPSRVLSEHLHFVRMPKGQPWVISNGDKSSEASALHFLVSVVFYFVLFLVASYALQRMSRSKRS